MKKRGVKIPFTGRKSQITFFIIAGILVLLLISLIFYYRNLMIEKKEIIAPEIMPVKDYVEECISETAKDAILLLGEQGGFIEIPGEIENDPGSYIENGFYKIPFWYYETELRIPPLAREDGDYSMEEQVDSYINENIKACFQNFDVFKNKFEIEEKGKMIIKTTIGEKDIVVNLEYPLKIKTKAKDEVNYVTQYSKKIDVRLKEIYLLAKAIIDYENNHLFFEDMTINLMSMNPDIPFTDIQLHCGYLKWLLSDIEKNLKDMVYYNMQKVRADKTNYAAFIADSSVYEELSKYTMEDIYDGNYPDIPLPDDAYDYFNHFMRLNIKPTDLKVSFIYQPFYGMNLLARPSSQGILSSSLQKGPGKYLSYLCINLYHFTYDVIYPLQAAIRDDNAFNNKGYLFRFAFPVLIDHNEGNREITGHAVFQSPDTYVDYCSDLGGKTYDIRVLGTDEYGISNMELKAVNISYSCHKFICPLGATKPDQGAYRLRTMLPASCSYGYLVAEKQGYLKNELQVLDETDIDIPLKKLKTLDLDVVKHRSFGEEIAEARDIAGHEEVLIHMQSKDKPDYIIYKTYQNKELLDSSEKIELIDSDSSYDINILMVDTVDDILIGGYNAENITISYNEMAGKNKITFHVIEYLPKPFSKEEQYSMIMYLENNQEYKSALKPTFE